MASAKELRETISKNREALAAAVASASQWDSAKGVVEEAIKAEVQRAGQAAAILGGNPVPQQEWALGSASEAAETLRKLGPEVDKRFSWAEDRDLSKGRDGTTLEEILSSHAKQLQEAAGKIG